MASAAVNALAIGARQHDNPESAAGYPSSGWGKAAGRRFRSGRWLMDAAELVVGGERHLAPIPATIRGKRLTWTCP